LSSAEAISPAAVVAEALAWDRTPYHHQASARGVGCDCLGLVRGVWRGLYGDEPEQPPRYSPDWAEATGEETLAAAARRWLIEIPRDQVAAGDVVLFRMIANGPAKHCAILIDDGRMIHATNGDGVRLETYSRPWRTRTAFAFRFPPLKG